MAERKPSLSDPQVRSKLAKLKKLGLYNGNLRKKTPTEYGRKVLARYMDVLEGRAHVVTVTPEKGKGSRQRKGYKEARQGYGEVARVVRNKVVVRKEQEKETARYNKRTKTVETFSGDYKRTIIRRRVTNVSELPDLQKKQAYAVPFNRWGRTEYVTVLSKDELQKILQEYAGKYKNILNYVQLMTFRGKVRRDLVVEDDDDGEDE